MRSIRIAGFVLAGAAALAACGSGSGYSNSKSAAPVVSTASSGTVGVRSTSLGNVLTNPQGRTLYGLTTDSANMSTCNGACAQVWPPVIVSSTWKAGSGVSAKFHTITRADGQLQLATAKWPLYTFTGDTAPGNVNGQGTESFFVVQSDGALHKSVAPAMGMVPVISGY